MRLLTLGLSFHRQQSRRRSDGTIVTRTIRWHLRNLVVVDHAVEERGRRQRLLVADNNKLASAINLARPERETFSRNANGVRAIHQLPAFAFTPLALGLNENVELLAARGINRTEGIPRKHLRSLVKDDDIE